MRTRQRVIIESPFAGKTPLERQVYQLYLYAAVRHSLDSREAPFASHGFYTKMLDDNLPAERELGISAGLTWHHGADLIAVYLDFGISPGMQRGMDHARDAKRPIERRFLPRSYWSPLIESYYAREGAPSCP